ncbi:hypothetical protein ACLOJK_010443 [Asimina triloba]
MTRISSAIVDRSYDCWRGGARAGRLGFGKRTTTNVIIDNWEDDEERRGTIREAEEMRGEGEVKREENEQIRMTRGGNRRRELIGAYGGYLAGSLGDVDWSEGGVRVWGDSGVSWRLGGGRCRLE